MLYVKPANSTDLEKEWLFVKDMPEDENGLTNSWHDVTREDFEHKALPAMRKAEKGEDLPDWMVPETILFLWEEETIVGQFRIRHYLNNALREGAGHIGYFIARPFRGKGYGTEGLMLTLDVARRIVPEEEFYLRVNRDNPASLRVMEKNGGRVVAEDADKYYVRIPNPGKGLPTMGMADRLLVEAAGRNPGPWEQHSRYVAMAARAIAESTADLNPEKAYVLGLLHDIGRRFGKGHLQHVYDGYHYLLEQGYPEAAKIALTHSFNLKALKDYIGKFDISEEKQKELDELIEAATLDDYDLLIQLCDSVATGEGIVSLEERMQDVKSRYGYYPQEKWDRNMELKAYFEEKTGRNLYDIVDHLNA